MRNKGNFIPPSAAFVCTTYLSYWEDFCGFFRLSLVLTLLRGMETLVGLREGVRGILGTLYLVVCGTTGSGGETSPHNPLHTPSGRPGPRPLLWGACTIPGPSWVFSSPSSPLCFLSPMLHLPLFPHIPSCGQLGTLSLPTSGPCPYHSTP